MIENNKKKEKCTIQNVSGCFTAENMEAAFVMGALTALEDMKGMKVTDKDRGKIGRFFKHWFGCVHK